MQTRIVFYSKNVTLIILCHGLMFDMTKAKNNNNKDFKVSK